MYSSALLALALSVLPVLAAPQLKLAVHGPPTVTDIDNFVITTAITNIGDEPATLVNDPNSVLTSEWKTNVFSIISDTGVPAKFKGVMVKWSPGETIKAGKFTVIQPGETRVITQDLSGVYDLSQSGEGAYTITPHGDFQFVSAEGKLSPIAAAVTPLQAKVTGKLASSKAGSFRTKRVNFNGCDSRQQAEIGEAAIAAVDLIAVANEYLKNIDTATPRYESWFGTFDQDRAITVQEHFNRMNDGQPIGPAVYDCTCTRQGVFAYVYPDQHYNIYLCPAFWNAPLMGTDSRAGTIVHEMSHFNIVGATRDYAYGQPRCRSLANSDPKTAIMNADSHEYFAENTPFEP